jgi:transposase
MDMQNETRIIVCWELYEKGVPKSRIARELERNRGTIHLWIKGIEKKGVIGFLDEYRQSKKGERKKRKANPFVKRMVWEIRERESDCCGQKIQYFLELERGIHLSVTKIYEILSEKYILHPKYKKIRVSGKVPEATRPREVIQMDTIDFGQLYAFTAVDTFTREADILIVPELTSRYGREFLYRSMRKRFGGHVEILQTDGGPEFKAEFLDNIYFFGDRHRIARPYKKNEQAFIESFNRTVRKECLGWQKYDLGEIGECQKLAEAFLIRYHYHRPHMGLGMTPPLSEKERDCRISKLN